LEILLFGNYEFKIQNGQLYFERGKILKFCEKAAA
jgi:hypothetical protein